MHGYCGAGEESTIQWLGRPCRRSRTQTQTVLYVYGLSGSSVGVKRQASNAHLVDAKPQIEKSQGKP